MRIQFGNVTLESMVCVLCGEREATTREHIPPRCIFLESPEQYLVVPACHTCNDETKLDDEYLRNVMAGSSRTEEGLQVWREKVRPKLRNFPATRGGLRDQITNRVISAPRYGSMPVMVIEASRKRIIRVARKMVWGLYWFHTGTILASDTPLNVQMLNMVQLSKVMEDEEKVDAINQTVVGLYRDAEVIKTFFYRAIITPPNSLWYFFFYRQNALVAYTGQPTGAVGG